ncbi:MAG: hypothetical protein U0Q15_19485 [Kineosporiaceae bacterium]
MRAAATTRSAPACARVLDVVPLSPAGPVHRLTELGGTLTLGRGSASTPVDVVLADAPVLSRVAFELHLAEDGVRVVCRQRRGGVVEVLGEGGHVAQTLVQGQQLLSPLPSFRVRVRADRVVVEVRVDQSPPRPGLATLTLEACTVEPWSADSLFAFVAGSEWRRVVALACARTTYPRGTAAGPAGAGDAPARAHVPTFTWLRSACERLRGEPVSQRWLSDRLDEALDAFGEPRDGTDKLSRLVPMMLRARVLADDVLLRLARQLEGAGDG